MLVYFIHPQVPNGKNRGGGPGKFPEGLLYSVKMGKAFPNVPYAIQCTESHSGEKPCTCLNFICSMEGKDSWVK